jgi:hypothetical protein
MISGADEPRMSLCCSRTSARVGNLHARFLKRDEAGTFEETWAMVVGLMQVQNNLGRIG